MLPREYVKADGTLLSTVWPPLFTLGCLLHQQRLYPFHELQTLDPQALKSLLDANGHSPTDQHHHHQDVEVAKAVAGVNFTVRIIADTTSDYNEYLSHRPERLAPCPPVTPFSAY